MGLTGDDLDLAIQTASTQERLALIEDFLYEGDVMMLFGDPGAGKSIVVTQLCCHLTTGQLAFDFLKVGTPKNVYYLQLEGRPEQSYERIARMASKVNRDSRRLYWDYRKGLDLLSRDQQQELLTSIATWGSTRMSS